ncbi:uncharacterized protein LOC123686112 [Harmonia axyridis]|uniref:uncharacterized protein LOC123686112 n=1 Tax=Harmonia axyridis TaxID=115357 RepID=UPI001E27813D|nr:uncharacterized protein LOC123686112 [Harmonia axyridis]
MSCKVNMTNGVSLNVDNHMYAKAPALDASVKLAGEEAKDRLYESKHKKKLVRVLTVIAYVFFVSLAAIMLSLYYIFIWNCDQKPTTQPYAKAYSRCENIHYPGYQHPHFNNEILELRASKTTSESILKMDEADSAWSESNFNSVAENGLEKSSPLIRKLFRNKFLYNRNHIG